MDRYSKNEKSLNELRNEIVADILETLKEKGYGVGDTIKYDIYTKPMFKIEFDRLLINLFINEDQWYHTDNISTDNLLAYLRYAYHVLPKTQ